VASSRRGRRRSAMEKEKRLRERHRLVRISHPFKAASSAMPWSRKDAPSLGKMLFCVV
jgi:hypothetical protein